MEFFEVRPKTTGTLRILGGPSNLSPSNMVCHYTEEFTKVSSLSFPHMRIECVCG